MDLLTLQNTYEEYFNNHKEQYLSFLQTIIEPDMQSLVIGTSTVKAIRIENNYLNVYLTNNPVFPSIGDLPAIKFPLFNPTIPNHDIQKEETQFLIDSFWDFWSFCQQENVVVKKTDLPMFQSVKDNVHGLIKPSKKVSVPFDAVVSFTYQKDEIYTIIRTFYNHYLIYPKNENISEVLVCDASDIENLQLVFPDADIILSNKKG